MGDNDVLYIYIYIVLSHIFSHIITFHIKFIWIFMMIITYVLAASRHVVLVGADVHGVHGAEVLRAKADAHLEI